MTADPPLTDAERRHLYELLADAWDCGRVGEPSCDELYAEARELVTAAWERRRPELDALLALEEAVRFRTRSDLDWHGLDGGLHVEEHVWHRERQLLAALDRIREETS